MAADTLELVQRIIHILACLLSSYPRTIFYSVYVSSGLFHLRLPVIKFSVTARKQQENFRRDVSCLQCRCVTAKTITA